MWPCMTGILNCALAMVNLYGWSQNMVSLHTKMRVWWWGGWKEEVVMGPHGTSCSSSRLSSQDYSVLCNNLLLSLSLFCAITLLDVA